MVPAVWGAGPETREGGPRTAGAAETTEFLPQNPGLQQRFGAPRPKTPRSGYVNGERVACRDLNDLSEGERDPPAFL
jgi:hypothetical protein